MWLEIEGVIHIDLLHAAEISGYNVEHLRRLAHQDKLYAQLKKGRWWTTDTAIREYKKADPRHKPYPGRRTGKGYKHG